MIFLDVWLLVRSHWFAVKHLCTFVTTPIFFKGIGGLKLRSVVRQDNRKARTESIVTNGILNGVDSGKDMALCVGIQQNRCHKGAIAKEQGKQNFTTFSADYGIHFYNRFFGIQGRISIEIFKGSPSSIGARRFNDPCLFPWFVTHFPRQIDISGTKGIHFKVVVECTLRTVDFIPVMRVDMRDGLTLQDERRDQFIKSIQLCGAYANTFSACCKNLFVVGLCNFSTIMILFMEATGLVRTPVTYMRKLGDPTARFHPIIRTLFVAVQGFALFTQTVTQSATKVLYFAFLTAAAAGYLFVFIAGTDDSVSFDFF